jgi:hypothetical protein
MFEQELHRISDTRDGNANIDNSVANHFAKTRAPINGKPCKLHLLQPFAEHHLGEGARRVSNHHPAKAPEIRDPVTPPCLFP